MLTIADKRHENKSVSSLSCTLTYMTYDLLNDTFLRVKTPGTMQEELIQDALMESLTNLTAGDYMNVSLQVEVVAKRHSPSDETIVDEGFITGRVETVLNLEVSGPIAIFSTGERVYLTSS
jgi:hypothetical protein